jgi:alginate production protein
MKFVRYSGWMPLLAIFAGLPAFAAAGEKNMAPSPFLIEGQVRVQGVGENNTGMGMGSDSTGLLGAEGKLKVTARLGENSHFYWEGRGVAGLGHSGFETDDTGSVSSENNFLEWRESYFEFDNIGKQPFIVKAGRQRVKEPYGVWWNQNFDAVRLAYDTTLFRGFVLAGQNLFSYNSSRDFTDDERDIARVLAEGSWQYHYQQFFETRLMFQNDHSGIDDIGTIQEPDDRNSMDGNLVWAGVRAAGKTRAFAGADKIHYRVDVMGVAGSENFDMTAPSGTSNLIVTGTDERDVLGWAVDAGVDIPLVKDSRPLLHLGYAFGSGDDDPNGSTDHAFRQSGLDGNFSRIGALSQNSSNYGVVLRPQLSNIHILTAGLTSAVFQSSDVGLLYRYYRLAEPANALPSSGVNNTLNNDDRDLGHEIDLLFNTDISRHFNMGEKEAYLRTSLGAFRAGDAFGTNEGEVAARGLVELGVNF